VPSVGAVVIGAGVIGLAVARSLALAGHEVLILERNSRYGSETSSRNSEVIHAGIYYPRGSLKARLCVEGRDRLYQYCEERSIPHRRVGKLIFATGQDQYPALEGILDAARAAGVGDLERLDPASVRKIEPGLICAAALLSPSTGIVSAHDYMTALLGDAESNGAMLVTNTSVTRAHRRDGLWHLHVAGESDPVVSTPLLVNAAGLGSQAFAQNIDELDRRHVPPLYLARGVYFTCTRKLPVHHLLYPVPVPGGLGTHLTLDLDGRARFGPDVEWIDGLDYSVDPARHATFLAAARLIWPAIKADELVPGYAGIRPKITAPGEQAGDFTISTEHDHGAPGLVNLFGIESPGLTASLAIADRVATALAA
jgi:L-2-hydroxyglutarate oxidase LhgO